MHNLQTNHQKILIIGPSWLGDMVMAQALFKRLKQINPNTIIDVAAPPWSLPLLERMPEVNSKIELNLQHGEWSLIKRYKLGKQLQKLNYTKAIILPNSWKSALIPWFANIPERIGWIGEMRFGLLNNIKALNKATYPKMVERYIALANHKQPTLTDPLLRPKLIADPNNINLLKQKFNIKDNVPILALCLGAAFGEAKCWPNKYYIELAKIQAKHNWQVLLLGIDNNIQIDSNSPLIVNLLGKTSLLDTIDLLSLSQVIVCNDSGLMHIAASFNKNIIAIYGATSPTFTPPLADNVIIINKNLPCSPCFARVCPLKHHNCMQQITVQEISNYINNIKI